MEARCPPVRLELPHLCGSLVALAFSVLPLGAAATASADSSVRVVGCNPSSIASSLKTRGINVVAPTEDPAAEDSTLRTRMTTWMSQVESPPVMSSFRGSTAAFPKPRGVSERIIRRRLPRWQQ